MSGAVTPAATEGSPTTRLAGLVRRAGRPRPGDLVAGLSVALVLIPQSLAYGSLAGLPPEHGLYAAALTPFAAALFASSPYLQPGPTGLTALLTFGALTAIAAPLSPEYIALAALLALVVGVVRVATGLFRAGALAYLMSQSVILGFSSAAAILIVASQVPAVLGTTADSENPLVAAVNALMQPAAWSVASIALAGLTVAVVLGARRIHPLLPGALIAVVAGSALSVALGYLGPIVGPIPSGLPPISLDLPWQETPSLIVPGLVIALLGFAEPAAIARRYAALERRSWDPNREFISQGVANFVAAASSGMPVGGSFARTALNRLAGAHSQWSAVITSLVVVALLPAMFLLAPLPMSVLAAIVIVSVVSLVDLASFREYWRLSRVQTAIAVLTFIATLVLAPHVERAVLVGIGAAIAAHLWREERLSLRTWRDGETLHLRPHGVLYFGSSPALEDLVIKALGTHRDARRLVIHIDGLGRVDLTGAMSVRRLIDEVREAGVEVTLVDVPTHAIKILTRVLGQTVPVRAPVEEGLTAPPAQGGHQPPDAGPPGAD